MLHFEQTHAASWLFGLCVVCRLSGTGPGSSHEHMSMTSECVILRFPAISDSDIRTSIVSFDCVEERLAMWRKSGKGEPSSLAAEHRLLRALTFLLSPLNDGRLAETQIMSWRLEADG